MKKKRKDGVFLFFLTILLLPLAGLSQEKSRTTVTLDLKEVTIADFFNAITRQTDLDFVHNAELTRNAGTVTVTARNEPVEDVLTRVLTPKNIRWTLSNGVIRIEPVAPQRPQNQTREVVTGRVVDEAGMPLVGVTVMIKGGQTGVATDNDGQFTINLLRGERLLFSCIGFKPVEVVFSGQQVINVRLEEDTAQIVDVVVTGIFNKPRESYTGAVSVITKEQIQNFKGQNLLQTLRNIEPAFNIIENNALGSNPNALPDIQIRGNSSLPSNLQELNEGTAAKVNTPLIVMDGFEISLQKLMDYNDEEIESINILKDAAATAIYGSRGANGVVVIITKAPQLGKLKVSVRSGFSLEVPDLTSYNMMNATEKLQLEYKSGFYNSTNLMTDIQYKQIYYRRLKAIEEGVDTYWLSQPLRIGFGQTHNVRFEGGREEFRWSASMAYRNIQGAMKGSERKIFNGGIVLSYLYKNLIFRNHTEVGINRSQESPYGSFNTYVSQQPYNAINDKEGNLIRYFGSFYSPNSQSIQNPLYDALLHSIDTSGYTEIVNNLSIEWTIVPELVLRGQLGVSHRNDARDYYLSPEHSSFIRETLLLRKGSYDYTTGQTNNYDANLTLSYSTIFGEKHALYTGLNYSNAQYFTEFYTFRTIGFTRDDPFIGNAIRYPDSGRPLASESKSRRLGLTSNINYTYDNRYYADASLRIDGSSQFGINNRFAPFWSIGIGWNIHREAFFRENRMVNALRLRLSYGETGSQNFSPYQALSMFRYYPDEIYGVRTGAYLMGLGNEELKWQKTDSYNAGVDFTLLNNRISGSFDTYIKQTNNLLSSMDLPFSTGFSSFVDNIGKVKNSGFEASLCGYVIRNAKRRITLMLTAKLAYNKNEIVQLSEDLKRQTERYITQNVEISTLYYEGLPQDGIYAMRSLGIDPTNGEEIFLDKDGNPTYTWSALGKVYLGPGNPLYNGNTGILFTYKELSLNLSFGYHWGGKKYNSTLLNRVEVTSSTIMNNNVDRRVLLDRWYAPGDNVFFKGSTVYTTRATSRFVMDDNVFNLQSASIQYRWRADFLRKVGIETLQFSVNMSDLFYFSSIKRERGTSYPFARTIGANISLIF